MAIMNPEEMRKGLDTPIAGSKEAPSEELPPLTMLSIDIKDGRGKHYVASFSYRVPTLGDQVEIGRIKSAYLPQGSQADRNAALLVEQICYLEVTIGKDNLPAWWKPFELYDASPVTALYAEAVKYERRFHGNTADLQLSPIEDQDASEEQPAATPPADDAMGAQVPSTAERPETLIAYSKGPS